MAGTDEETRQRVRLLRWIGRRLAILSALSLLILVVCPIGVWLSERDRNPNLRTLHSGYQWLARTLFETSSAYRLFTGPAFVLYYVVRITGVSLIAFGTGTIASRLVTTVILKGKGMGSTKAKDHVLICGWSTKGPEIVRELRSPRAEDRPHVVVLSRHTEDPTRGADVEFLSGDPADAQDLHRAGVERARTAIILADESDPNAGAGDRDARTLLTCLAVESIHPEVYSCVEVLRSENRPHFARTAVNEMVVSAELTGSLLGASARTHGLARLVSDLVARPGGQSLCRMRVPADCVGLTMSAALGHLKNDYDALLIGFVDTARDDFDLNPDGTRPVTADDVLLVITDNPGAISVHAIS